MGLIDRKKVMRSFGRQAAEYDSHSAVQKRVIEHLVTSLRNEALLPASLLDIGAGTGMLLRRLQGLYPDSQRVGIDLAPEMCRMARSNVPGENMHIIAADAERLPFAAGAFELVVSTSTLQWLNTLDFAFAEAFRVLAPGGLFCFALFGEKTLCELKDSYRLALAASGNRRADRSHLFFSSKDVADALLRVGFSRPFSCSELFFDVHEDVPALLRSLKKIGAGNASPLAPAGLAGRKVMLEMMDIYRRIHSKDGNIPATYEVIFAMGRKPIVP
jgi:malonyl-CoA O-methyltransferase